MIQVLTEIQNEYIFPDSSAVPFDGVEEKVFLYKNANNQDSTIRYCQMLSKDIYIGHQQLCLVSPEIFTFQWNHDVIQMHFVLKGKYELTRGKNQVVSLQAMEHNILFLTGDSVGLQVVDNDNLEYLEIQLRVSFVERYISQDHPLYQKISLGKPARLSKLNMPINSKIQGVLNDLICCELEGNLKSLYIKAKVIELLSLQLSQFQSADWVDHAGLKPLEISKMNLVRQIIVEAPEKSHSLADLARLAGTNEQYLKSHFKRIYGKTVFSYLTAQRMDIAKELLIEGNKKIAEVAQQVGYAHPSHFSKAFKKHFGYLPLKVKGAINVILYGFFEVMMHA